VEHTIWTHKWDCFDFWLWQKFIDCGGTTMNNTEYAGREIGLIKTLGKKHSWARASFRRFPNYSIPSNDGKWNGPLDCMLAGTFGTNLLMQSISDMESTTAVIQPCYFWSVIWKEMRFSLQYWDNWNNRWWKTTPFQLYLRIWCRILMTLGGFWAETY